MPCQGRRILNPVCLPFHHSGLTLRNPIGSNPVDRRSTAITRMLQDGRNDSRAADDLIHRVGF